MAHGAGLMPTEAPVPGRMPGACLTAQGGLTGHWRPRQNLQRRTLRCCDRPYYNNYGQLLQSSALAVVGKCDEAKSGGLQSVPTDCTTLSECIMIDC